MQGIPNFQAPASMPHHSDLSSYHWKNSDTFAFADNRIYSIIPLQANLFLSGIAQLIGTILADKLDRHKLYKIIRKLLAQAVLEDFLYDPPAF